MLAKAVQHRRAIGAVFVRNGWAISRARGVKMTNTRVPSHEHTGYHLLSVTQSCELHPRESRRFWPTQSSPRPSASVMTRRWFEAPISFCLVHEVAISAGTNLTKLERRAISRRKRVQRCGIVLIVPLRGRVLGASGPKRTCSCMGSADGVVTATVEAALVPDGQIQARAMATDVHSAIALRRWRRMSGANRCEREGTAEKTGARR
jgi:hypothetical protein